MNVALWNEDRKEYYLVGVRRKECGAYAAQGKRVSCDGRLLELCQEFEFDSQEDAERKCWRLERTKRRIGGYRVVPLESLPTKAQGHLEVPPEMQLTPQEMVEFVSKMRSERYVVLRDVSGMEEWFDAGVQYLGYVSDDEDVVLVHDRFGRLRHCFRDRAESISETEVSLSVAMLRSGLCSVPQG